MDRTLICREFVILYYIIVILVLSVSCSDILSVSKCCPQGEALSEQCIKSNNTKVNPYIPSNGQISEYRPLDCGSFDHYFLNPDEFPEDEYHLFHNSSLYLVLNHVLLEPDKYCMEFMIEMNEIRPMICFEDETNLENVETMKVYSIGMWLSLPFLFFTFLTYLVIRELHTLHGRFLVQHVFALFTSYVILSFLQQFTYTLIERDCTILGYSVQYFFLATFFWLNVMCIDIYWAFSSVRSRGGRAGGDIRKLLLYSLYAWGMPLVILLITVGVDFSDLVPDSSPFKPKVGTNKCFFDDRTSAFMYFYGPMGILLGANMILFGITAYRIWRTSKETAALNRGDSRRHSDRQENERFKLYVKLFLVMGINWVAELLSFIFGDQVPHYLWYVTDLTNTLQGVFIFIIFVWKRRVRRLVWDRLCMITGRKGISRSRGGTSSDTTTTTSINNTGVSQLRLNSVGLVQ